MKQITDSPPPTKPKTAELLDGSSVVTIDELRKAVSLAEFDTYDKMCMMAINMWIECYHNPNFTQQDRAQILASVNILTTLTPSEIDNLYRNNFTNA